MDGNIYQYESRLKKGEDKKFATFVVFCLSEQMSTSAAAI
jgi:hypothetical protein